MLSALPPINKEEYTINRVPQVLHKMNETAFTPQVVSIGPFHHGKPNLKAIEQLKLHAVKIYLTRLNMRVEADAMSIARRWEKNACSCYGDPVCMNSDDFVKMMLVDGCFILELMITSLTDNIFDDEIESSELHSSLFHGIWYDLVRDLSLFENQLPFFVLQDLFDLLPPRKNKDPLSFMKHMAELLVGSSKKLYILPPDATSTQKVKHLVDLSRFFYIPSPNTEEYKKNIGTKEFLHPPTITELCEAGVKLQIEKRSKKLDGLQL